MTHATGKNHTLVGEGLAPLPTGKCNIEIGTPWPVYDARRMTRDGGALVAVSVPDPDDFDGPYMTINTPNGMFRAAIAHDLTVTYDADFHLARVESDTAESDHVISLCNRDPEVHAAAMARMDALFEGPADRK